MKTREGQAFRDKSFQDRADAGRWLAKKLVAYAEQPDVVVLGLARGGVPVAYEIATALHLPLDVLIVRKLGIPGHEEFAMGAIASGGVRVLNQDMIEHLGIGEEIIDRVTQMERAELLRRERAYRGDCPVPEVSGKTVIIVDDGIATGATLFAAIVLLRTQNPKRIIVATGVAPPDVASELAAEVDEFVCLIQPTPFGGVGHWYERFLSTSDEEVQVLMKQSSTQIMT